MDLPASIIQDPMITIVIYLSAIISANLSLLYFGPQAAVYIGFLFIGLDLTLRDRLHDHWRNRGLFWKMAILILSGSLISWVFNSGVSRIAIASFSAFLLSGSADAVTYHLLRSRPRMIRVNGSNLAGALVDSIAFPTLAFWAIMPGIIIYTFIAKTLGGVFWSVLLRSRNDRAPDL